MKSVTSATPVGLKKRVSRIAVSGRYSCLLEHGMAGAIRKLPPMSASSTAANRLGASKRRGQNQSMLPSRPTSAAVRRSPMSP